MCRISNIRAVYGSPSPDNWVLLFFVRIISYTSYTLNTITIFFVRTISYTTLTQSPHHRHSGVIFSFFTISYIHQHVYLNKTLVKHHTEIAKSYVPSTCISMNILEISKLYYSGVYTCSSSPVMVTYTSKVGHEDIYIYVSGDVYALSTLHIVPVGEVCDPE